MIRKFDFDSGRVIAKKYELISKLGEGWEGEVYKIKELSTGIVRAAKFFYPERNIKNKTSILYAKKLHKLKDCPTSIAYYAQENFTFKKHNITVLISDYIDGIKLTEYLLKQKSKRLSPFQGVHLLYAIVLGIENIHSNGEYHGDLHTDNVIVEKSGLSYELKLLDFYHYGRTNQTNRQEDISDSIRIFYDALGGSKHYAKHNKIVKDICCGLKHSLIIKKFPTASSLRLHLENLHWQ